MTIAEFLQALSDRIGIDNADEGLKQIVTNPALSNIEVPSHIIQSVQKNLMTEDEAKVNYKVKSHFIAPALSSIDKKIAEVLESIGLDEDVKEMVLGESNTYNRIPLLAKAIADTKEKASSATGGDKKALLDKINELQGLLNGEREARKKDLEQVNSQWQSQLTDKELQSLFSGYDYGLDLDKDVTITTARNLWEKKLREKGGKYVYTQEGLKLVNAEAPDLPFTIDNKSVDIRSFTDSVLAESKMLRVNKAPATPTGTPMPAQPAGQTPKPSPAAKSQTSKALADFKSGSVSMI